MEGCEIAGYSNIKKIKEPLFCKEAKLHGAQALQPLKITNVQVWKKIKLQGSQTCYCAAKTKKLQGTQTFTGWSLRQQRVWQKIKLHDSQTFSLLFPLWRRAKLHGSQTCTITSSASSWVWRSVKLHGTQTHATLSSQNTLGSGRNCRILKQGCRRFCFVIIIPYPDRKANICSIRLRAEKGEV